MISYLKIIYILPKLLPCFEFEIEHRMYELCKRKENSGSISDIDNHV